MLEISYKEAKLIALQQAMTMLGEHLKFDDLDIFERKAIEGSECWIFLINKNYPFAKEAAFSASAAYAVSKFGKVRVVADFSKDAEKMSELLSLLDNYFKKVRPEKT